MMKTPDLTPAQLVSTVIGVLGLLVTQGLIDNEQEKLIAGFASILIPVAWQIADAIIRHGRATGQVVSNPRKRRQTSRPS